MEIGRQEKGPGAVDPPLQGLEVEEEDRLRAGDQLPPHHHQLAPHHWETIGRRVVAAKEEGNGGN